MAHILSYSASETLPTSTRTASGWSTSLAIFRRVVNAIVASRVDAAERELRRRALPIRETELVYGEYRRIGLDRADLLPFTE